MVRRYKLCHEKGYQSQMFVRPDGQWVMFRDYAALEARVAAADALFDKVSGKYVDYTLAEALAAYQATKEQSDG